eukprot:1608652-Pyramimonas_sp.AAC.1
MIHYCYYYYLDDVAADGGVEGVLHFLFELDLPLPQHNLPLRLDQLRQHLRQEGEQRCHDNTGHVLHGARAAGGAGSPNRVLAETHRRFTDTWPTSVLIESTRQGVAGPYA